MFIVPQNMQVHGFGPLNWLAGRKVSDLVQETLLQVKSLCLRRFVIFFIIPVIIVVHHWKWSSCSGGWVGAKARPWGSARPTFNLLSGYKISWFSWICYWKREQNNQIFPLQAVESESPGLVPIGLLVHWTFLLVSPAHFHWTLSDSRYWTDVIS